MSSERGKLRFGLWYEFRNPTQEKAGQRSPINLRNHEDLRQSGYLKVVEPEAAVKTIREYINSVPLTHFYSWTLPPGLPPKWAQPHLELFASKVIPAFR